MVHADVMDDLEMRFAATDRIQVGDVELVERV